MCSASPAGAPVLPGSSRGLCFVPPAGQLASVRRFSPPPSTWTTTSITLWEAGSEPLASVSSPVIEELAAALRRMGAQPVLVADLFVAAWCDLVLGAIAEGDDASCLLADPLARDNAFSELLAWAMTGQPPARHRPYASAGQLL